jgi:hypothetical protein
MNTDFRAGRRAVGGDPVVQRPPGKEQKREAVGYAPL